MDKNNKKTNDSQPKTIGEICQDIWDVHRTYTTTRFAVQNDDGTNGDPFWQFPKLEEDCPTQLIEIRKNLRPFLSESVIAHPNWHKEVTAQHMAIMELADNLRYTVIQESISAKDVYEGVKAISTPLKNFANLIASHGRVIAHSDKKNLDSAYLDNPSPESIAQLLLGKHDAEKEELLCVVISTAKEIAKGKSRYRQLMQQHLGLNEQLYKKYEKQKERFEDNNPDEWNKILRNPNAILAAELTRKLPFLK